MSSKLLAFTPFFLLVFSLAVTGATVKRQKTVTDTYNKVVSEVGNKLRAGGVAATYIGSFIDSKQTQKSAGNLQYTSVVYLHSAADRDDSRWCFKKVQVSSAKLSDANGISTLIAKSFRGPELDEGLKVLSSMGQKEDNLENKLARHYTKNWFTTSTKQESTSKDVVTSATESKPATVYTLTKPQWLGAVDKKETKKPQEVPKVEEEADEFRKQFGETGRFKPGNSDSVELSFAGVDIVQKDV
ncbi:hypothetical protein Tco_0978462 [Tanacetum coccineum]|uniref:Uncharacterized protein n=1 Tax=Tanacetum coccineum TaxID=301880 RepID=A0ABQ5EN43_9ASTR